MARVGVDRHVFEDGAELPGGLVYLRFAFGRQADDLRVAATLKIEDTVIAPAMFVIADQGPFRIGGERGFAGPGQAKENRHVILILAIVGRTVHGHHAALRQQIIHHREDGFFDFSGVGGAADEDEFLPEIQQHKCFGAGPVHFRVGVKVWRMNDREFRLVSRELLGIEFANEHITRK